MIDLDQHLTDLLDAAADLARYAGDPAAADRLILADHTVDRAQLEQAYTAASAKVRAGSDVRPWTDLQCAYQVLDDAARSPL